MRKIIQISAIEGDNFLLSGRHVQLYALCDDGSLWALYAFSGGMSEWRQLDNVPQDNPRAA